MTFQEFFKIATDGQFAGFAEANETQLHNEWADIQRKFLNQGYSVEDASMQAAGYAGQMLIDIAEGRRGCAHEDWYNSGLRGAVCCGCGRGMTHSSRLGRAIPNVAP